MNQKTRQRILADIYDHREEGMSSAEMAERLAISPSSARRYLAEFAEEGILLMRPDYRKKGRPFIRYYYNYDWQPDRQRAAEGGTA